MNHAHNHASQFISELQQRGLIEQCSDLEALTARMDCEHYGPLPFYLGIDPTASSLHCGHLLPILLAKRLALQGHQPLLVVGGGTAKIGDPSGKTELRRMMSTEEIESNANAIQTQLEGLFADCPTKPIWLNNADWLDSLNYIEFLRDIGCHFSVNRMLGFESYKQRLERGLSFIEFNYQLLQSYDYLVLFERYGCVLQIGGSDQWGNMVSGIDLIRRYGHSQQEQRQGQRQTEEAKPLPQVLTVPLVLTADGKKMGKTEGGAIFLDPAQTSPFAFFQYWRNCSDQDVERFLLLFSFLPLEQIRELCREQGAALNEAKQILAHELCQSIHGKREAERALAAAKAGFGSDGNGSDIDKLPSGPLPFSRLKAGVELLDLYTEAGLCSSRNEGRRLIQGGGAALNGQKMNDPQKRITQADIENGRLLLRAGKKRLFCFAITEE